MLYTIYTFRCIRIHLFDHVIDLTRMAVNSCTQLQTHICVPMCRYYIYASSFHCRATCHRRDCCKWLSEHFRKLSSIFSHGCYTVAEWESVTSLAIVFMGIPVDASVIVSRDFYLFVSLLLISFTANSLLSFNPLFLTLLSTSLFPHVCLSPGMFFFLYYS